MKITLISPYTDISALNIRSLSAFLKISNYDVRVLFLPNFDAEKRDVTPQYSAAILEQAAELCKDSDLIGISLMTNYFYCVAQLTGALKKLNIPILWGGIHPTIRAEECLKYADMVCIGDGEEALLELVTCMKKGEEYHHVRNFYFKDGDTVIKNPVRPVLQNLDMLPDFDYDMKGHFIADGDNIKEMDDALLKKYLALSEASKFSNTICYQTMSTRGCPHNCTYCCNSVYHELYPHQKLLRKRNINRVVDEIARIKQKFPFISMVMLSDDCFFSHKEEDVKLFSELYKAKVSLPFYILGSPITITKNKMEYLVNAGMEYIQIGIESGSPNALDIYKRKYFYPKTMETIKLIHSFTDRIKPPIYDFLVDNPYEKPEDVIETYRYILEMPRPYRLNIFSLIFFPGTELYNRAKADNLIKDEEKEIYKKKYDSRKVDYFALLFSLARYPVFPKGFLYLMSSKYVVKVFNSKFLTPLIALMMEMLRGAKRFVRLNKNAHNPHIS